MARIKRDDAERVHDYNLYLPKRTIYLGSIGQNEDEAGVDSALAEQLIKNLLILDVEPYDPITIIMNCVGGDFYHGSAIYDCIKSCKSHVTVKVFGHAFSMGSIILQAADERIMAPSAIQMIHYGSDGIHAEAVSAQNAARENSRANKWMESVYLEKMRKVDPYFKQSKLKSMLSHDTYLTAQESIDLGLADKILGEE